MAWIKVHLTLETPVGVNKKYLTCATFYNGWVLDKILCELKLKNIIDVITVRTLQTNIINDKKLAGGSVQSILCELKTENNRLY